MKIHHHSLKNAVVPLAISAAFLLPTVLLKAEDSSGFTAPILVGIYDSGTSTEFTRNDGYRLNNVAVAGNNGNFLNSGNWLVGTAARYLGGATQLGQFSWVANITTGETILPGLYDTVDQPGIYTSNVGKQITTISDVTDLGIAVGRSEIYQGNASRTGLAPWIANLNTGETFRIGLYNGAEFTSSTGVQSSDYQGNSKTGYVAGSSNRYNGEATQRGVAAWVADASGNTIRVGLWDAPGSGTNEFTRSDGTQTSTLPNPDPVVASLTNGFIFGTSTRYNGTANGLGQAAWVSKLDGTTYRVGIWDAPGSSTSEFTSSAGEQYSAVGTPNTNGWTYGISRRYNGGSAQRGQAAYITNANTGVSTRVGLYTDPEYTVQTGTLTGQQFSAIQALTESGYFAGYSNFYIGTDTGARTWVSTVANPSNLQLIGYTGSEYTAQNGLQSSSISALTESGWVAGSSSRYSGFDSLGQRAWVARVSDVSHLTAVGLYEGTEFTGSTGIVSSTVSAVTESGWVQGNSTRYLDGTTARGAAIWVANANAETVVSTRVGLWDAADAETKEFTDVNGRQISTVNATNGRINEAGILYGTSNRYNSANTTQLGTAQWVADASTGQTWRLGLWSAEYTSATGAQAGAVSGINDDYVWGYSYVKGGSGSDGLTSWVFDLETHGQVAFELSINPTTGYQLSYLEGFTDSGVAYGYYTLFDELTGANLGNRAFLWSEDWGVKTLDEEISGGVEQYGWAYLSSTKLANDDGYLAGIGTFNDGVNSQGVFIAQAVPEPSTVAVLSLGLGLLGLRRFRSVRQRSENLNA